MRNKDEPKTPPDDNTLDGLLSLWASQHSMSDAQSEAILIGLPKSQPCA